MIGFTPRVANTSREISSDASALPPGESMRRMIAPTLGSLRAAAIALDDRLAAGELAAEQRDRLATCRR